MDPQAHSQAAFRAGSAREAIRCCRLCPRNCAVDRTAGQKGFCSLDDTVCCFREMLASCDESQLNPSHHIYFAGCNLRCGFCTVAEWNQHPDAAPILDIQQLKARVAKRKRQGAKTLNLLGGEPAVSVHGILELLAELPARTVVVWNSNMYYNLIVDELIAGLVDICLADLKCGNADCAGRLVGADDYVEVVKRNILRAGRHSQVYLRHVIVPGHSRCCLEPILKWAADEMPQAKVSLRGDYVGPADAGKGPSGYLSPGELEMAYDLAQSLGLQVTQ